MRAPRSVLSLLAVTALSVAACATAGTEIVADPDAAVTRRDAGEPAPRDASTGSDASASLDGSSDGASQTEGGAAACLPLAACPVVRDLGSLSGDMGNAQRTVTGTRSEWLKVRFTEDSSSVSSTDLKMKVTLTSPPGENFDLFLYLAPSNQVAAIECSVVRAQSESVTQVDALAVSWVDNQPIGGQDDSKNATIEVRHVSGPCAAGGTWSLQVDGNTLN